MDGWLVMDGFVRFPCFSLPCGDRAGSRVPWGGWLWTVRLAEEAGSSAGFWGPASPNTTSFWLLPSPGDPAEPGRPPFRSKAFSGEKKLSRFQELTKCLCCRLLTKGESPPHTSEQNWRKVLHFFPRVVCWRPLSPPSVSPGFPRPSL